MHMKLFTLILTILCCAAASAGTPPLQRPDCGHIDRLYVFSPQLGDTVPVDVWTPPAYSEAQDSLPVIYMHDGQNLYDASTTWNRQAWEVDSVMCALLSSGQARPAIIVGIHSDAATRIPTLMPQKAVADMPLAESLRAGKLKGKPVRGDAYAAFMVETLKPLIDSTYRTLPGRPYTSVMGSSMGGLMSIYALCEYPDVFGNALCLSTHWTGDPAIAPEFAAALYDYIDSHLPPAASFVEDGYVPMLYFDRGTETLDAAYGPYDDRVIAMLRAKGYGTAHLMTHVAKGAAHEERAWRDRLHLPLRFILHP